MPAGPGGIHYQNSAPTITGYGNNCMMVVNARASRTQAAAINTLRQAGTEVLEYVLPVHDYPGPNGGVDEWVSFYTGGVGSDYARSNIPAAWFWDPDTPSRVTVGAYSGYVMDMRANSAWSDHMLDWFAARMADPNWKMDGWMLDVLGDGWLGAISGLTTPEQVAYRAGVVSFAQRLRARLGDEVLLVANNTWQTSVPLNGLCLENHSTPGDYYYGQLALMSPPLSRRRNCTVNGTVELVQTWAAVSGVDHAFLHSNDGYMVAPSPPFGTVVTGPWPIGANHFVMWDSTSSGGPTYPDTWLQPEDFPLGDSAEREDQSPAGGPWLNMGPSGASGGLRVVDGQLATTGDTLRGDLFTTVYTRSEGPIVAGAEFAATPGEQYFWLADPSSPYEGYAVHYEPGEPLEILHFHDDEETSPTQLDYSTTSVDLSLGDALALVAEPTGELVVWTRIGGIWDIKVVGEEANYTSLTPGWEAVSSSNRLEFFWGGQLSNVEPPEAPGPVTNFSLSAPEHGAIQLTFKMPAEPCHNYVSRYKVGANQTFSGPEDGNEFRSASASPLENILTGANEFQKGDYTVAVWAAFSGVYSSLVKGNVTVTKAPVVHSGTRVSRPRTVAPNRRV